MGNAAFGLLCRLVCWKSQHNSDTCQISKDVVYAMASRTEIDVLCEHGFLDHNGDSFELHGIDGMFLLEADA